MISLWRQTSSLWRRAQMSDWLLYMHRRFNRRTLRCILFFELNCNFWARLFLIISKRSNVREICVCLRIIGSYAELSGFSAMLYNSYAASLSLCLCHRNSCNNRWKVQRCRIWPNPEIRRMSTPLVVDAHRKYKHSNISWCNKCATRHFKSHCIVFVTHCLCFYICTTCMQTRN